MAATCAALVLVGSSACNAQAGDAPSPGPGGGPVDVRPSHAPEPGATLTLHLAADGSDTGSACTTLDEWVDGGWRARWYWRRSSSRPVAIPPGEERTCPAIALPLPAEQTVVVPADLSDGTWRFAYDADGDLGAYVFEV
jgi:hypothetical protein